MASSVPAPGPPPSAVGNVDPALLAAGPVTERSNELCGEMDRLTSPGLLELFQAVDEQLFVGYGGFPGLGDAAVGAGIEALAAAAAWALRGDGGPGSEGAGDADTGAGGGVSRPGAIVLSGAGTSGRSAFAAARGLNAVLARAGRPPVAYALLAGGPAALLRPVELAEDDGPAAAAALAALDAALRAADGPGAPPRPMLIVGISCGLSAAAVAAHLDYGLRRPGGRTAVALIGFNPPALVRPAMAAVVSAMQARVAAPAPAPAAAAGAGAPPHPVLLLTPIVGPECVSGSTRLKGGSATKMMLEGALALAAARALGSPFLGRPLPPAGAGDDAAALAGGWAALMSAFRAAWAAVYAPGAAASLAAIAESASECLRQGGHIYYIGSGGAGLAGVMDAAEQVPTFGCLPEDIRGFMHGGAGALGLPVEADSTAAAAAADGGGAASAGAASAGAAGAVGAGAGGVAVPAAAFAGIAVADFVSKVLPSAGPNDLIIALGGTLGAAEAAEAAGAAKAEAEAAGAVLAAVASRGVRLAAIDLSPRGGPAGAGSGDDAAADGGHGRLAAAAAASGLLARIAPVAAGGPAGAATDASNAIPFPLLIDGVDAVAELAIKLALNAVSSSAQVRLGKVFRSRMIDVRLSNRKLWARAALIVSELASVRLPAAQDALLHAVYGAPAATLPESVRDAADVGDHVVAAKTAGRQLVPVALLLATGRYDLPSARAALEGVAACVRDLVIAASAAGLPN